MTIATIRKIKTFAAVGALTAGLTGYMAGPALAAPPHTVHNGYELDSDVPLTIGMDVTVDESVDVTITDVSLGVIGVHQSPVTGDGSDTATLKITPAGGETDTATQGRESRLVLKGGGTPQAGEVVIANAFPGALVYEHYENIVSLSCADAVGTTPCSTTTTSQGQPNSTTIIAGTGSVGPVAYAPPVFDIIDIVDNIDTKGHGGSGLGANGTKGHWVAGSPPTVTDGIATVKTDGTADWDIGLTISTHAGVPFYASGTYKGSFDITLSY